MTAGSATFAPSASVPREAPAHEMAAGPKGPALMGRRRVQKDPPYMDTHALD